jgi:hypothetical protein
MDFVAAVIGDGAGLRNSAMQPKKSSNAPRYLWLE